MGVPSMGCEDPKFAVSVGTKNTSNLLGLEGVNIKNKPTIFREL